MRCAARVCCAVCTYFDLSPISPLSLWAFNSNAHPQAIQSNGRLEALSVYYTTIGSEGCDFSMTFIVHSLFLPPIIH